MQPRNPEFSEGVSLDWPLSRDEKKSCVLRLYDKDLRAANKLLRSGEAALATLRQELQVIRPVEGHAAAVAGHPAGNHSSQLGGSLASTSSGSYALSRRPPILDREESLGNARYSGSIVPSGSKIRRRWSTADLRIGLAIGAEEEGLELDSGVAEPCISQEEQPADLHDCNAQTFWCEAETQAEREAAAKASEAAERLRIAIATATSALSELLETTHNNEAHQSCNTPLGSTGRILRARSEGSRSDMGMQRAPGALKGDRRRRSRSGEPLRVSFADDMMLQLEDGTPKKEICDAIATCIAESKTTKQEILEENTRFTQEETPKKEIFKASIRCIEEDVVSKKMILDGVADSIWERSPTFTDGEPEPDPSTPDQPVFPTQCHNPVTLGSGAIDRNWWLESSYASMGSKAVPYLSLGARCHNAEDLRDVVPATCTLHKSHLAEPRQLFKGGSDAWKNPCSVQVTADNSEKKPHIMLHDKVNLDAHPSERLCASPQCGHRATMERLQVAHTPRPVVQCATTSKETFSLPAPRRASEGTVPSTSRSKELVPLKLVRRSSHSGTNRDMQGDQNKTTSTWKVTPRSSRRSIGSVTAPLSRPSIAIEDDPGPKAPPAPATLIDFL